MIFIKPHECINFTAKIETNPGYMALLVCRQCHNCACRGLSQFLLSLLGNDNFVRFMCSRRTSIAASIATHYHKRNTSVCSEGKKKGIIPSINNFLFVCTSFFYFIATRWKVLCVTFILDVLFIANSYLDFHRLSSP